MLTEELKPPKRARNPPQKWVEQKKKKRRKKSARKIGQLHANQGNWNTMHENKLKICLKT